MVLDLFLFPLMVVGRRIQIEEAFFSFFKKKEWFYI